MKEADKWALKRKSGFIWHFLFYRKIGNCWKTENFVANLISHLRKGLIHEAIAADKQKDITHEVYRQIFSVNVCVCYLCRKVCLECQSSLIQF